MRLPLSPAEVLKLITSSVLSRRTVREGLLSNTWVFDLVRELSFDGAIQFFNLWEAASGVRATLADHASTRPAKNRMYAGEEHICSQKNAAVDRYGKGNCNFF
jgi:hypothetical protein